MGIYGVYLSALPFMIFSTVLYPYPKQEKKWELALQGGLAMMDFLDMAELLFGDIGCYVNYEGGWVGFFFTSIGVSTILTAVNKGLEQPKREDDEEKNGFDFIITLLRLVFNDIFFCILRLHVMLSMGHMYVGVIFLCKEILSAVIRIFMLIRFCCYRNSGKHYA